MADVHAGTAAACTCEVKVTQRYSKRVRFCTAKNETWVIPRKLESSWGSWHTNLPSYATSIVSSAAEAEALAMIDSLTECIITSLDAAEDDSESDGSDSEGGDENSIEALLESIDALPTFRTDAFERKRVVDLPANITAVAAAQSSHSQSQSQSPAAKRRRLCLAPHKHMHVHMHMQRTPLADITDEESVSVRCAVEGSKVEATPSSPVTVAGVV